MPFDLSRLQKPKEPSKPSKKDSSGAPPQPPQEINMHPTGINAPAKPVAPLPASTACHANPHSPTLTNPSTFSKKFAHRLVATPMAIEFGVLMEGFRYATTFQLTNIATTGCRFRVEVPNDGSASWLTLDYPRLPMAAGISVRVTVEVDGYQPIGAVTVLLHVSHEGGGNFPVALHLQTRSAQERPVSQQRSGVRMIGPSPIKYIPSNASTSGIPPLGKGEHSDDDA
jgi:hypothetical protein